MENNFNEIHSKNESKDPKNYKGVFYFNKKDSRVFVPKWQNYRGYTINFGNPLAYILIVVVIGFIVLFSLV